MTKKFAIPLLLTAALCLCACAKKNADNKTKTAEAVISAEDIRYVDGLLDNALRLKFLIMDYIMNNKVPPQNLDILNYPGISFMASEIARPDGSKKELVTGYIEKDKVYVRYEPTSFGKKGFPMLSVSPEKGISTTKASVQWANNVLTCVAPVDSTEANAACKRFKSKPDSSNPIMNYYNLDDVIPQEHKQQILAEVEQFIKTKTPPVEDSEPVNN